MISAIQYHSSLKKFVLSLFDRSVDDQGYVVEKSNLAKRSLTSDGQEIHIDEFAGLKKGSLVFIKKDLPSLVQLLGAIK